MLEKANESVRRAGLSGSVTTVRSTIQDLQERIDESVQVAGYELPKNLFQTFLNKGGKNGQSLETPVRGTSARR